MAFGKEVILVDSKYFMSFVVDLLIGVSINLKIQLGWESKFDVEFSVNEMVLANVFKLMGEMILRNTELIIKFLICKQ